MLQDKVYDFGFDGTTVELGIVSLGTSTADGTKKAVKVRRGREGERREERGREGREGEGKRGEEKRGRDRRGGGREVGREERRIMI